MANPRILIINQKHFNSLALSFHKECGPQRAGEAAAKAYDAAARKYHKEFAQLNFPEDAPLANFRCKR
ncbi:MAG: hypothetical protein ABSG97_04665 [Sedimentisphaerales bacterium]